MPPFDDKYRLLVEAVTDYAIYLLQPSGHISSWNSGAQRFKGYTAAEIIGEHFSRFYTEEDRFAGRPENALAVAAKEGRFEGEGWRIRKDGKRFWAHVVIDPVWADDGTLRGYAKITRDLTEQRKADEVLRRSQEQFRLLVQGVADYAIYMLDNEGHVNSWNAGAERIKGYREDEILGRHFSHFYTPEDVVAGQPRRNLEIARQQGSFESEGWRVRKDGTRFLAHVVIDRIDDEHGDVIGFAKITRDVTEKKVAEQALASVREALFQAQKNEAIGQLTGGVAHDFNNLLMAVISNLDLLAKRLPDNPPAQGLLANAMAGVQRGASLTQRMLAFARRQELHPEPNDIPTLVMGMADLLQRSLGPGTGIFTQFPLGLPAVMIDGNQLELALLNLAVNGRDAMPAGGKLLIGARREVVPVGARSTTRLAPGNYVCLWVTDEGEGMDAETVQRAPEPFFTTKGVGKGTGLGLSMAHGLAEQSGGRLVIRSEKGSGTTVELWLPVAMNQAFAPAAVPSPDTRAPDIHSPLNVLLVDDDDLVLLSTAYLFQDMGHTVYEAGSGDQALQIMRGRDDIDLVVTDQAMPGMTGTTLAELLRAERPQLPVILASGYAQLPEGDIPDVIRLAKPFREADLHRAIDQAMQGTGSSVESTRSD